MLVNNVYNLHNVQRPYNMPEELENKQKIRINQCFEKKGEERTALHEYM